MKKRVKALDQVAVAVSIESVKFKKLGSFNQAKKFKYKSIMFNLKNLESQDFRRKIHKVKPERLVGWTTKEMASNKRQC